MPSPAWFFSTLAQSTAASIGFIIALSTVLFEAENQPDIVAEIFHYLLKQCKYLFLVGVILPMFFLLAEPSQIDVSTMIPHYELFLLFVQISLTTIVGIYGYQMIVQFQKLITTAHIKDEYIDRTSE